MKALDLTGQKFGRLTVISFYGYIPGKINPKRVARAWNCKCDCGVLCFVKQGHLVEGHTQSCGCLNNEQRSARAKNMYEAHRKWTPEEASAHRVYQNRYADGDITFKQFFELSKQNCYYCDIVPNNNSNCFAHKNSKTIKETGKLNNHSQESIDNGNFIYNGLDRVDSSKLHNLDNVVPCCTRCNWAKSDQAQEEFLLWLKRVYEHSKKLIDNLK